MRPDTTIAIAGGGIGGLAAAIALDHAGFDVTVYEQAPAIESVGAGIALWPNATRVLDRLGIGPMVRKRAVPWHGTLRSADGRILLRQPATVLHERYHAPTVALPRSILQAALLEHVGADRVRLGKVCVGYRQRGERVDVSFADGTTTQADVLVGADGVRSAVRREMLDDGPARYRGDTAWRAIIDVPDDLRPLRVGFETFGRGARFGMVPGHGDTALWFASDDRPEHERDGADVRERLLATYATWHDPIPRFLAATEPSAIVRSNIYHRRVTDRWVDGRVALLGDAAHPMGPDGGQGACQAIEDAAALADALAGTANVTDGLLTYQRTRYPRVARVARTVEMMGRLGRMRHPLLCAVRDRGLAATPQRLVVRQLDSIVNG